VSLGSSRSSLEEAYVNTLGTQAMAQAVSWLGKTFDHFASALAGEASWPLVFEPAWERSLLVSTGVVALAEIGDKTQLLAFVLAARDPHHAQYVAATSPAIKGRYTGGRDSVWLNRTSARGGCIAPQRAMHLEPRLSPAHHGFSTMRD
jgi:hypothetical protein